MNLFYNFWFLQFISKLNFVFHHLNRSGVLIFFMLWWCHDSWFISLLMLRLNMSHSILIRFPLRRYFRLKCRLEYSFSKRCRLFRYNQGLLWALFSFMIWYFAFVLSFLGIIIFFYNFLIHIISLCNDLHHCWSFLKASWASHSRIGK